MNLYEIQHELIGDTAANDWYRIMVAGPSFHYRWQYGSGGKGAFSYIIGEHTDHAVCRLEPSLTMSWGMPVHEDRDEREMHYPWAQGFVTKTVHEFWVDFFWNNALIDRVELGRVDGGHGVVPMPGYGLQVTDFAMVVAFLVHGLEDGQDGDNPRRYVEQLGFKRIADAAREGAGSHH